MVERSPVFHMRISDGHFFKADPVIRTLPPFIRTPKAAHLWAVANPSPNCADVSYGPETITVRWSHSVCDGPYMSQSLSSIGTPLTRSRQYMFNPSELFEKLYEKVSLSSNASLQRHGFAVYHSHAARPTDTVVLLQEAMPVQELVAWDPKKKRPVKMSEHTWAALLISGIVLNLLNSGHVDLSRSGIDTLVTLRRYMDPSVDKWCIGNAYSHSIPHAGAISLDEGLDKITGRIRKEMDRQLNEYMPLYFDWCPRPPPGGSPLLMSSFGTMMMSPKIIDAEIDEAVQGINVFDPSEAHLGVTQFTMQFGEETKQTFFLQYNPGFVSAVDGAMFARMFTQSMRRVRLEMTLRQAMLTVNPYIKAFLGYI
jgi:hypothetical protein